MFELMPFDRRTRRMLSYDPFGMDDFFAAPARPAGSLFRTDVIDSGEAFELDAELPGMSRDDIGITVEDNTLVISAEQKKESDKSEANYVRRERCFGSFRRSFTLDGIDTDAISASYADGVLRVILPKLPEQKPEARRIEIA